MTSHKSGALLFAVIMCLMLVLPSFIAIENRPLDPNRSNNVNAQVYADPQSLADSKAYWLNLATNAWQYFQPNNGVNSVTGLESNAVGSNQFTDWDLGTYVQAIVEAEKLGILSAEGAWGANARIDKVLTFLEQRPLINDPGQPDNGQPYAWYYADLPYRNIPGSAAQVAWDAGNLLVALKNVENYGPTSSFKSRVDAIVYSRTNYEPEAQVAASEVGGILDVYNYYLVLGFSSFFNNYNGWSDFVAPNFTSYAKTILNNIVNSPNVSMGLPPPYDGVKLPKGDILCEPLLLAIFGTQQPDPTLLTFSRQVYLAQEARYNATGKFTAFSEGGATSQYVYEWIVFNNGDTWEVQNPSYNVLSISPVIYLKVAVSFLALYNTSFAQNMVSYLTPRMPAPATGYSCGVDESGTIVYDIEDKTNSMIISAARYAIENNVTLPSSLTSPSPSQSSSSAPSATSPTITATAYSAPIPTIAPQSSTPTLAPSPGSSQISSSEPSTTTPLTSPTITANQTSSTVSPSASTTPLSSSETGAPWQINPVIVFAIVVVVAIAVILPVIILRRNGSSKPH